jgi:16S rRNA (cytosine967-C5)-methyltransferase
MIAPARVAAYECQLALSGGGTDLAAALEQVRGRLGDPRDRALATEIATGVQRWRATLDHLIAAFAKRRLDQLDREIVEILRIGAYQLLHLTRVPAAAVVDDAVNLAGRVGKASAKGFVNAVLRKLARSRTSLPLPPRPADPSNHEAAITYLSVSLSHPEWLVRRWLNRFGFDDTETWLQFNNMPAPLTLRANRLRTTRDALQAELQRLDIPATPTRFAPDGLVIARGDRASTADLERLDGQFLIQDEASQLVALLAGPHPGPLVLDACASPGGKTTALAAAMGEGKGLVACDVRDKRLSVLRRTLDAAGLRGVPLVQLDLRRALPFRVQFDCVLVDAPCSGLGTLRRDPDIKWRCQPADLPAFAHSQQQMLRRAAAVVAPGGRLIYATCSSEPEENEAIAGDFVSTPGFRRLDATAIHPDLPAAVVDAAGDLRTSPPRHGLEAFYGAVFERNAAAEPRRSG